MLISPRDFVDNRHLRRLAPALRDGTSRSVRWSGPLALEVRRKGGGSWNESFSATRVIDYLSSVPPSRYIADAFDSEWPPLLLEHTSINPVHAVHLAALRGSLVAHAMITAWRALGADVTTTYFINDLGKQVRILVDAVRRAGSLDRRPPHVRFDRAVGVVYAAANMVAAGRWADIDVLSRRFPWLDDVLDITELSLGASATDSEHEDELRSQLVEGMRAAAAHDLAMFGIDIDRWEYESTLDLPPVHRLAAVTRMRTVRINGTLCASTPGGRIPLVRPNGVPFYFTKDVENVRSRPFVNMTHVIGDDQAFLQRELSQLAARDGKNLRTFGIGYVTVHGKASSARQHRIVCVEDIENEAGLEGVRALALGMLSVPHRARLRLPLPQEKWIPKVLTQLRAPLREARTTVDEAAAAELLTFILRAPGIIRSVTKRGNTHALVSLLRHVLDAYSRAGAGLPETVSAHAEQLLDLLAVSCGLRTQEKNERKEYA